MNPRKKSLEEFKRKNIELLDHLIKLGWVESYIYGDKGLAVRWTDRGERYAAVLHLMDDELKITESFWTIMLTLCDDMPLHLGRQVLEGKK